MKNYFPEESDMTSTRPQWMTLFISLMLVMLTLFIFLSTFAESDKAKVETFKKYFRENLLLPKEDRKGFKSIVDVGGPVDPISTIINRMKSEGINKKLMDDFLTLNQIKDLEVRDGKKGIAIILPEVVGFEKDSTQLTKKSITFLTNISYLIEDLPYLVEIKGYSTSSVPPGYKDALEFSAKRAAAVYSFLLEKEEISPVKLKVSGCGDSFADSSVPQDKVEIVFKEADL